MIVIRRANKENYKELANLGRETFYETWIHAHPEEDMKVYLAEAFDDQKIKSDLGSSYNTFLLGFLNDELIGYVKLRTDRLPEKQDLNGKPAIEMERIYVRSTHQGKKIGKALMDASLRIAKENNFEVMWLGVNEHNHKAVNFYKRYGFVIFGTKTFKIGNTVDQDYVMKLSLL